MFFGSRFLIFATFTAAVVAQSQNPELINYLLGVQDDTRQYYEMMEEVITNTRSIMVQGTMDYNINAVNDIAEALKAIVEIRDEVEPLFNDATGSEQCISATVSAWQAALNSSGSAIASCVQKDELLEIIEVINSELVEQHAFIFDVQNLILSSFSGVNIITNQQGLTPFVNTEAVRIVQTFVGYTAMRFGSLLTELDRISRNEMFQLQSCIADVVSRVQDEAIVVANTLEFC